MQTRNGSQEHLPDSACESGQKCLTEGCGLSVLKRGLCGRCDAERRRYQKQHPEITDEILVALNLLAAKTSPPGRQKGTKEREPRWLPFAAIRLSRPLGRRLLARQQGTRPTQG